MHCEPNQPNRTPCQSCPSPNDFVNIPQGFGLTRIVREALQTNMELTQCLADFCGVGTGTGQDGGPYNVVDNNDGTLTVTDTTSNQSFDLDLKTVLEHLDFTQLTETQLTDLCTALVDSGCDITSLVDFSTLSSAQNIAFCAVVADCPQITGITHTSITNIDLRPTGTPNEFTVEITWIDEDGNTQVTTDPTPISVQASDDTETTFLTSNTVYDLLNFPPAGPVNPPTDPTSGDTVIQRFQNGLGYFTYNGTSWDLNLFETDDNQTFTCRDETGQDYVQGSLAGPQNPPPNPSQADTHLEVYDNAAVIFNFQESGPAAGWDGNNICFIPLGSGSSVVEIQTNIPDLVTDPVTDPLGPGPSDGEIVVQCYDDGFVLSIFDGTDWQNKAVKSNCNIPVQKFVLNNTEMLGQADFGTGAQLPSINGGVSSDPGEEALQDYIDNNIDYSTPTGTQSSLTPPDTTIAAVTDSGWVEFYAHVPAGETVDMSWSFSGEGYCRIEVDECGCNGYSVADRAYSNPDSTVEHTLAEGFHRVRVTSVDVGGNASIWSYNGDAFDFYPVSSGVVAEYVNLLASCDGTLTNLDGTDFTGTVLNPSSWVCGTGVKVKASDIIGDVIGEIDGSQVVCKTTDPITGASGTLGNGTNYTATVNTGNVSFNSNGAINFDNSNILTLTFDSSVDLTIADDLAFWQLFNGARSSITTNGDNFDLSNFSFTDVTNDGQVITYSGGSSNGSTGWGSLVAPNATEVVIQGVGVDQLIFVASTRRTACEVMSGLVSGGDKLSNIECYTDGNNEFDVFTYCDGTQKAFNKLTGAEVDISEGIPGNENIGSEFTVTQPDDDAGAGTTGYPVVAGVVEFARGGNSGIFNLISETSFGGDSPADTLWRNDTETEFTNFTNAYGGQIGMNILTPAYGNAIMQVISTGQIFEVTPVSWQQGGGGGFSFTFQEVQLGWQVCPEDGFQITKDRCEVDTLAARQLQNATWELSENASLDTTIPATVTLSDTGASARNSVSVIPNETYNVTGTVQQTTAQNINTSEITVNIYDSDGVSVLGTESHNPQNSLSTNYFIGSLVPSGDELFVEYVNTSPTTAALQALSTIVEGPQVVGFLQEVCQVAPDGTETRLALYQNGQPYTGPFSVRDCPTGCTQTLKCINDNAEDVFNAIEQFIQPEDDCTSITTELADTDFTLDGAILFNGGLRFGAAGADGGSAEASTQASTEHSNELSYDVIAIGGVFPDHELTAEVLDSSGNVLATGVTANITGTVSSETLVFATPDSNVTVRFTNTSPAGTGGSGDIGVSEISVTQTCEDISLAQILDLTNKCHTANYVEKVFNADNLITVHNYNSDATNTFDNATFTDAQLTTFLDAFDYSQPADDISTQADLSYVDFVGGAGTESNLSFMEGFVELLSPVDVMTSRTQNYAVRIELGENCGEYVTLLDHHNGPNGAPASPAVTLPAGIHRIRITAFDYDGANGNFNFETNGAGGGFVTGIDGITLSTLSPTDRCFVGRVCEGSDDVLDIEQNVVVDASLLCSSEGSPAPASNSGLQSVTGFQVDTSDAANPVVEQQHLIAPMGGGVFDIQLFDALSNPNGHSHIVAWNDSGVPQNVTGLNGNGIIVQPGEGLDIYSDEDGGWIAHSDAPNVTTGSNFTSIESGTYRDLTFEVPSTLDGNEVITFPIPFSAAPNEWDIQVSIRNDGGLGNSAPAIVSGTVTASQVTVNRDDGTDNAESPFVIVRVRGLI